MMQVVEGRNADTKRVGRKLKSKDKVCPRSMHAVRDAFSLKKANPDYWTNPWDCASPFAPKFHYSIFEGEGSQVRKSVSP